MSAKPLDCFGRILDLGCGADAVLATPVTFLAYSASQCIALSNSCEFPSSGKNVIQISSSYTRRGNGRDAGLVVASMGSIRRHRSRHADSAARESVAATDRPERGAAIPQPPAGRSP